MELTAQNKNNRNLHESRRLAIISLGLNAFLTASKYLLYLFTGSYALLSETVHSLTDIIGSTLVVGGIHFSQKKSKQFPWGLYKVENLAAVFSAGMIFVSAYGIAKKIIHPYQTVLKNLNITLIMLFLMVIPIMIFARYEAKKAKVINSPALIADAENWKMDVAPLAIVAVGIVASRFSYPVMDKVAAVVVLVLVVRAGYGILKDSMRSLLDASVDKATLLEIENIIKGFPQVKEIVSLHARNSGSFIFVYLDLRLSLKRLKDANEISRDIENEIRKKISFVERVIIHYEPGHKNYERYAVMLANREGVLSEHFGSAPFVALWDKAPDRGIINQEILKNPFKNLEKGKGIKLAEMLISRELDKLYTKEDFTGKGPEYVLSDAEVNVRKTDLKTLKEVIEKKDDVIIDRGF